MNQPTPSHRNYQRVISDIESGRIKIPQFQRDFVWDRRKSAALIDSILKGFPIGTFILWHTKERLRTVRNLGGADLNDTPMGDYAHQVLDGQQRLTSLFAATRGLKIDREGRADDYRRITVDLTANPEDDGPIVVADPEDLEPDTPHVSLHDLMSAQLAQLASDHGTALERISLYRQRINSYQFPVIEVHDAPLAVATEIFTRINVGGKALSVFEIMVAKTYDPKRKFDLSQASDTFNEALEDVGYGSISHTVFMQTVAALAGKTIRKKDLLNMDRDTFIDMWPAAVDAIKLAVDYFRDSMRIPVSALLPYQQLLIPFGYFFHHHPARPSGATKQRLIDFFFRVGLTSRYSGPTETKVAQDLRRMDAILAERDVEYDDTVNITADAVNAEGGFRTGQAYTKTLLCVLAWHQPRSFKTGDLVRLDNAWLKRVNSKNYHHFFPRKFLRDSGEEEQWINHIANITLVDDYLNKRDIRDQAPSVYLAKFAETNDELNAVLDTHLISLEWANEDDYDAFFLNRCAAIARALAERVIVRRGDQGGLDPAA